MFISVIDTGFFLSFPKLREKKKKKRTLHRDFHLSFSLETERESIPVGCLENALYRVICESSHQASGNVSKH